MKKITIYYKDNKIETFEIDSDDFDYIVSLLYTKYKDAIGYEVKSIEKEKKL